MFATYFKKEKHIFSHKNSPSYTSNNNKINTWAERPANKICKYVLYKTFFSYMANWSTALKIPSLRGWNKFYSIQLTSFIFISVSLKVTFSLTISLGFLLYSWSIVRELRRSTSSLIVLAETNYYIYSPTILEKKFDENIYIKKVCLQSNLSLRTPL